MIARRPHLPRFHEDEAVLALFEKDVFVTQMLKAWNWDSDDDVLWDLSLNAFKQALALAEQNDPGELIRLTKARIKREEDREKRPRKRGRPALSRAEKMGSNPTHTAARMVPLVRFLLMQWYPDEATERINARADEVAAKIVGDETGEKIESATLRGYLSRSKSDKRRLDWD